MEVRKFGDRKRTKLICKDKSLTQQNFAQETIIENIMAKYRQTGVVTHLNTRTPEYGDYLTAVDYKTALDQIHAIEDDFDALDSATRKKYDNDPLKYLEAVEKGEFELHSPLEGLEAKKQAHDAAQALVQGDDHPSENSQKTDTPVSETPAE